MRRLILTSFITSICCLPSHAGIIFPGTQVPVANGGTAPGSPVDFDFGDFGRGAQPTFLTDFTVSVGTDYEFAGDPYYTTLIAPDGTGPFTTGIAYDDQFIPHTGLLATFSPTSDGSFTVWILDGNTDGNNVGNTTIGLGVNGGPAVNTATVYSGVNEFTEYNVLGGLTTDVYQVYATTGVNTSPSIGGLTFTAPVTGVPEPSTFVLGLAAMGLVIARRRRAGSDAV